MAKCMRPSKLHLKKDLTSLRKPCFFWDPETFLTWRSTLRSRSMASSIYQKGASGNSAGSNKSISSRRERSKRVYLYNWKTHPTKSTDHGTKLSVDRQGLKTAGSEENIGNLMKKNLKSETSPDNNATSESIEVSERKTRRMPCRRAISGKQTFSVLSSIKEHGIKECCKSEDRTDDRRESSNTPWSYSSHNKYAVQSPEVAEKETFPNEDEVCQMKTHKEWIPCYWSKRTKDRAARNCYSSSPFNTVRRKERKNIFRSRKFNYKRTPSESHRQKQVRHSQAFPLLKSSYYQGGSSADYLSSSFGEHCLETLSQLNRRTWMNRSQEAQKFDLLGHDNKGKLEKRLSEKYRPRSFGEIIGQRNVVQSLSNAILKGKLGPALLFQGPRGTGKTSTARVLAASLNCLSTEEIKPCGFCKECTGIFAYQNGSNMKEVDATNKNAIDDVIFLLKNICATKMITHYEIFVIDRCDKLSLKIWSEFMKIFEEPPPHLIFIFVTSDPEKLPMPILARCQKYIFAIIKETDIVSRLRELSAKENLDVELEALDSIANYSDGSLQDAETMLDQLSLLGKRITSSHVNALVGIVSDEKLLNLLQIAMSSDTTETIKRSRELMDSGVDPVSLMSRLIGLMMDTISGTHRMVNRQEDGTVFVGESLTEDELEKLQLALKILSDAERQIRSSSERSTCFTAALLQLCSVHNQETAIASSSSKQLNKYSTKKALENSLLEGNFSTSLILSASVANVKPGHVTPGVLPRNVSVDRALVDGMRKEVDTGKRSFLCVDPFKLDEIWTRCIKKSQSEPLRQVLTHGKLVSITETEGQLMAYVAFQNHEAKFRAKKSLSSLTDLIEEVLRQNVDFRIGLLSEISLEAPKSVSESTFRQYNESTKFSGDLGKLESSSMIASSEKNLFSKFHKLPRKNIDYLEGKAQRTLDRYHSSTLQDQVFQESSLPTHRNKNDTRQRRQGTAVNKTCTETVQEPRLDAAWLQTVDTGGFRSDTHPKPQRNHVLPHYSITCQNKTASSVLPCIPSRHWEEEPSNTIEINLKESQGKNKKKTAVLPDQFSHPISINLLHHNASTSNFLQKLGNTTEPGHTRILSWKSSKLIQGKVRQGNQLKSQNDGSILCFGCCWKSKAKDSRYTR